MNYFPILFIHGEYRQCQIRTGHPTHYSVHAQGLGWARVPKWVVWRALEAQKKTPIAA